MAQKNLIAVSAKIGNGKDTLYDFLQQKTRNVYENKKFAWKLKEIAEAFLVNQKRVITAAKA